MRNFRVSSEFDDTELQTSAHDSVSAFRQAELREAIGDAPLAQFLHMIMHQLLGWPLYLIKNASGQLDYPVGTNRKLVNLSQ
jgi:hypothetical protein